MHKTISIIIILLIISCQKIQAGTGDLYLADHLVNLDNFNHIGHFSLTKGTWFQPNTATFKIIGNEESILQPKSYLPVTQSLETQNNYVYTFDFSLNNFQVNDSFDVIFHYRSASEYSLLRFKLKDTNMGTILGCNVIYHKDGQESEVREYSTSQDGLIQFKAGQIYTMQIKSRNGFEDFTMWQKNQPRAYKFYMFSTITTPRLQSIYLPQISLKRSQVSSNQAQLNLHRFYFTDPDYLFDVPLNLVNQNNPEWSREILGHTDKTDRPQTIGEIGCLLSSVTMIFNSFGYYQLPNGEQLNPSTLNQWLKTQKDGYINKNLLNLAALTRLSNQLHQFYAKQGLTYPKFEYQVINTASNPLLHTALDSLQQDQTFIIEIPGHFLVANGVKATGQIKIRDPYYTQYQNYQQHDELNQNYISIRRFIPSLTDQSLLIFNLFGDAQISLVSEDGTPFTEIPIYEPNSAQENSNKEIGTQYIAIKPESGTYKIQVDNVKKGSQFSFFIYNENGEVALHNEEPTEIQKAFELVFSYDKTAMQNFYVHTLDSENLAQKWQNMFSSDKWDWHYVNLILKDKWENNNLWQIRKLALDFFQRHLLNAELYDEIIKLLDITQ